MQAKLSYQWKEKRRARLSYFGLSVCYTFLFYIIDTIFYEWYLSVYPERANDVLLNSFFPNYSFTHSAGIFEIVMLIIQMYVFTLIFTQRMRDISFKYPIIIGLVVNLISYFIIPLTMFSNSILVTIAIIFIFCVELIALFAPSTNKVEIKNKKTDCDKNNNLIS